MSPSARRSWLLVPASKPREIEQAARSGADVIVLDLVELVAAPHQTAARAGARAAIEAAGSAGAQVFVQTAAESQAADLQAAVWPGLSGVLVSRAESATQVAKIAASLSRLEAERGLTAGKLAIVAALETARGNDAAWEIARASPRVAGLTLGRADLVMDLRPEPSGEIHLLPYLMQRLVIVAGAAGLAPLGAWWRAPDRGLLATPENTRRAAQRGRAIGFKGALCLRADQVEPLNSAYAR